jgi:hypothetical protein
MLGFVHRVHPVGCPSVSVVSGGRLVGWWASPSRGAPAVSSGCVLLGFPWSGHTGCPLRMSRVSRSIEGVDAVNAFAFSLRATHHAVQKKNALLRALAVLKPLVASLRELQAPLHRKWGQGAARRDGPHRDHPAPARAGAFVWHLSGSDDPGAPMLAGPGASA